MMDRWWTELHGTPFFDSGRGWWIIGIEFTQDLEEMMGHWSSRALHGTHSLILYSEWWIIGIEFHMGTILPFLREDDGSLMNWTVTGCLLMQISLPESWGQKAPKIVCRIGVIEWPISTTLLFYRGSIPLLCQFIDEEEQWHWSFC
jgi:hypothetical protein